MKFLISTLVSLVLISTINISCQKETEFIETYLSAPAVEAGIPQTIQLPAPSFTLSGSATTSNGYITAYLWSLISGPNVPIITSPGSATTTVAGFIPGIYKFQLMATDSAGLTGVDSTSITLIAAPIQTLTLQPSNNPNEAILSWTNSGNQTGANFSLQEIAGGAWTLGGENFLIRGLVKFDLSSIPANSNILSAKLTLYSNPFPLNGDGVNANSGSSNAMYIERATSSWNSSLDWINQPSGDISTQILIPHTSASQLDLVDIDVKTLVSNMISLGNNGFKIRLQNETPYNIRNFCSSKFSNSEKHPKLVITYQ